MRMKRILAIAVLFSSGLPASSRIDDPLAGVEDLILAGRHGEAQAAAEQARRIFGQRQDRAHEAHAVLVLAAAKLVAGDFAGAAADCETSASMLEGPGDRFSRWIALWHLGLLKGARKQFNDAIAQHRGALAVLREIETSPEPLSTEGLKYLGRYLGIYFQEPPGTLRLPPAQPEIVKPKLLRIAEAMTRRALLDALLSAGRLEEAEAELSRLGELSHQLGGMFSKEATLYRGTLRRLQWRLDEAREIFRQALAETSLAPGLELEILASLIELEVVNRRFEEALALTDRALGLARRHGAAREETKLLLFRASILRDAKQLGDAEADLLKSLDMAQRSGKVYEQALAHQQLGFLALTEGRPEQAAVQFETAARLFQAGDRPEEEARIRLQLSQIYAQLNARTSAEAALARARELAGKSGSRWVLAMADVLGAVERSRAGTGTMAEVEDSLLALLALPEVREVQPSEDRERLIDLLADLSRVLDGPDRRLSTHVGGEEEGFAALLGIPRLIRGLAYFQRGQFAEARRLWLAALAEEPRNDIRIILLAFTGFSYVREGNDQAAIRSLAQAVDVVEKTVEDVRLEELLAGYLGSEKQFLFAELIDLLVRNGRTVEAFNYAERSRARAFLQGLGNPRLTIPQGADPKLAQEVEEVRKYIIDLQRKGASASGDDQKRLSSELAQARERYQSLLVRLKVIYRDRTPWAPVEPQQIPAIREQLGPEISLISYFVSSSRIHAWVLDQEELRHIALPLDPQGLRWAVCWADQFGRRRSARMIDSQCGADPAQAEEIYVKLIAPLRGFIRHRRLIVIPHGELHYLPFAAMRDPQTGRYLVEDFTLTYAPSASAIGFLRSKETAVEGEALIFGPPEESGPRQLDAARREAALVGRLFGTRPWIGKEAMEGVLYQSSQNIDLLHIAAHGEYESRNPLFSHIALALDKEHDGNLEVHEILSDLDLSGVNLVVLSACETARGERSRGDEITSLTRAFLYAGSPGVISTLWSIDDKAAAVLMGEFYTRLLAGASAADALRQAQLALLRSPLYRHPRFWAAFSLAGDPQGKWTQSHRKVNP